MAKLFKVTKYIAEDAPNSILNLRKFLYGQQRL